MPHKWCCIFHNMLSVPHLLKFKGLHILFYRVYVWVLCSSYNKHNLFQRFQASVHEEWTLNTFKMKATHFFEMSRSNYSMTDCHIPVDWNPHVHSCENLTTQIISFHLLIHPFSHKMWQWTCQIQFTRPTFNTSASM